MQPEVKGRLLDDETRCVHYHSTLDIIAIKFKCCDTYYPCFYCHEETAGHAHQVWKKEDLEQKAILCGNCKQELTIAQYKSAHYHCPFCNAAFNPKCSNHDHLYFEQ